MQSEDEGSGSEETGGAGGGGGDEVIVTTPDEARKNRYVSYERFTEVNTQFAAAKKQLEGLPALQDQVDSLGRERNALSADVRLAELGLDGEGRQIARTLYGNLPEKDRPALGDWVAGLREKGAEVPRGLAPYLGAEGSRPSFNPNSDVDHGSPPGGAVTTEQIEKATEEALRTGDWSKVEALDKAVLG